MAFNMTNTEREEFYSGLVIPATVASTVAAASYTIVTGVDAKVLTVPGLGEVTVKDLTSAGMTTDFIGDISKDIALDQRKYVSVAVERYDEFNSWLENVGAQVADKSAAEMAKTVDTYAFAQLAAGAGDTVVGTGLDETNVLAWIGDLQVKLDEKEAPEFGRVLTVTPGVANLIARVLATNSGSDGIATEAGRNGYLTSYSNFDIYKSNLLADGTTGKDCIATVRAANAMGLGWNEARVKEMEAHFADAYQAASVYGADTIKADWLVKSDVTLA